MIKIFITLGCIAILMGCAHYTLEDSLRIPQFRIALVNRTNHELNHVTCTYPGGEGLGGIIGPGSTSYSDAIWPSSGPVLIMWEEAGIKYRVEVPLLEHYIVRPQGILIIRILPDHTVNVSGMRVIDEMTGQPYSKGDPYPAEIINQAASRPAVR